MTQSYIWPLPDALKPGYFVRVRGTLQKDAKRFDINFQNETEYNKSELMLHISMRYSDGIGFMVNNSKNQNGWMEEEMHRHVNFHPGDSFEVLILCDYDKYQIALNGNHICNFSHRLPYSNVKCLGVRGEAILSLISYEDNNNPEINIIEADYRNPLPLVVARKKKLKKVIRCRVS